MDKEKLKKEAKEKYYNHKIIDFQGFYNRHYYYLGYVESAEPREERIATLEKENAIMARQIAKTSKELAEAKELIKDFLLMAKVEHLKGRYETVDEAEQFIEDIDK